MIGTFSLVGKTEVMASVGGLMIAMGLAAYFYGWIGRLVAHRWRELDPGDQRLSAAGRFQLYRQRAMMRQGPRWRWIGVAVTGLGVILLLVGLITA